jgi:GNAT superfamily N-acetyltransferase
MIQILKYSNGLENEISQFIKRVYDEFVANDYSEEGNNYFYDWIEASRIFERQQKGGSLLLAFIDLKIVGIIETRDINHISLLFVDKEYQGQGIARKLFYESILHCIRNGSNPEIFYVHASPYSVPIYKKLGFTETDKMQVQNGIKYLPMEIALNTIPYSEICM